MGTYTVQASEPVKVLLLRDRTLNEYVKDRLRRNCAACASE